MDIFFAEETKPERSSFFSRLVCVDSSPYRLFFYTLLDRFD